MTFVKRPGFERERAGTGYDSTRDAIKVIHDIESPFGEFLVVNRTPIIELNSSYGFSELRDLKTETNSGTVTSSSSEFVVSTGTTANSVASLFSAEVGRYIPGYSAELGIGVRLDTLPTGNQVARWGGYGQDENNGVYWGYDSGGLFVAILRDGTESNKVYQSSFNTDKLDGTGDSTFDLDLTNGYIYQIDFTWYGYGQITFGVVGTVNNVQRFIPAHTFSLFSETSLLTPNLKVFAEAVNGSTTSDLTFYVGGRQYSILGEYRPKFRVTGQSRASASVGTTLIPLISFRRKADFGDRSIKLEGLSLGVSTNDIEYYIILNGTLSGTTTFNTPSQYIASETALESNIVATGISGGNCIYSDIALQGQGNRSAFSRSTIDIDIPNGQTVSLCAKTNSGTASVISNFRLTEEW